ncbi:shikimate dehydrogenase family protein [Sphingomonas sp. RB1R13]|uniref:shikimate dehydrogenase family protein n=1 Tax=Sphingomonas sp. RB1R13 TaxID=3096159 RepID=UPI002FC82E65
MRAYSEVIGDPIAQSKSPTIHNFWLGKLGIEADYRATRVTIQELPDYFASRRTDSGWRGCNATMPLKQGIAALVDAVDPFAARAGAINIVVPDEAGLRGSNSDGAGFLEPLGEMMLSGGHAALIGTGGAARAIALALTDAGFTLSVHGRTAGSASAFIEAIGIDADAFAIGEKGRNSDATLLINATSLGMTGHPPFPISLAGFAPDTAVYDIVTSPLDTPLLIDSRTRGMRSFDGLQMLVGQAAVAFALFFGQPAPREHDAELRRLLTS